MTWQEWVPLTVGIIAIITALAGFLRYVIKNFLRQELHIIKHELQPNSGKSIKDQITRLEETQAIMKREQADHIKEQKADEGKLESRMDKIEEKIDKLFEIIISKLGN